MSDPDKHLQRLLDLYKMEVDFFWKRSAFCWAIIAAAFGGFFSLVVNGADALIRLLVAVIGCLVTFAWVLMNLGSQRWLTHYQVKIKPHPGEDFFDLGRGYFSITRINTVLSVILAVVWIVLVIYSHTDMPANDYMQCLYAAGLDFLLVLGGIVMGCVSYRGGGK